MYILDKSIDTELLFWSYLNLELGDLNSRNCLRSGGQEPKSHLLAGCFFLGAARGKLLHVLSLISAALVAAFASPYL